MAIRSLTTHTVRAGAVLLVVVAAVAAGIGWLYTLRHVALFKLGPTLTDALPLQRLAGGAGQPLGRMVVAWLPAGLAAGVGIALVSRLRRPARALAVFVLALALVVAASAASDSLTHNEPIRSHLHQQPHRPAAWLAAGLMALGAVLIPVIGPGAGRQEP